MTWNDLGINGIYLEYLVLQDKVVIRKFGGSKKVIYELNGSSAWEVIMANVAMIANTLGVPFTQDPLEAHGK